LGGTAVSTEPRCFAPGKFTLPTLEIIRKTQKNVTVKTSSGKRKEKEKRQEEWKIVYGGGVGNSKR